MGTGTFILVKDIGTDNQGQPRSLTDLPDDYPYSARLGSAEAPIATHGFLFRDEIPDFVQSKEHKGPVYVQQNEGSQ